VLLSAEGKIKIYFFTGRPKGGLKIFVFEKGPTSVPLQSVRMRNGGHRLSAPVIFEIPLAPLRLPSKLGASRANPLCISAPHPSSFPRSAKASQAKGQKHYRKECGLSCAAIWFWLIS